MNDGPTNTSAGRPQHPDRMPEALRVRASRLDDEWRARGPGETYLFWEFDPPLLSEVGYRLVEFDKEARRESARGTGGATDRVRPLRIGEAGFRVVDASPGSLDLLVQAIGVTDQVLRSDPVQFVIHVVAGVQAIRAIRSWIGRRGKIDGKISAEACREILAAADDQSVGWDDHGPHVRAPGRVTIFRQYPDGSYDMVMVEPGASQAPHG
jgi:hypothetical protein